MYYLDKIKEVAEASTTEICGLVINERGKPTFYNCNNIAGNKDNNFSIDPLDFIKYNELGEILFIVHSHVNTSELPSVEDIASCNSNKYPWIIYSTVTKKFHIEHPIGHKLGLLNRQYVFNVYDCWTLVKDYYKEKLNIELPKYIATNENWFLDATNNYFEQYAEEVGFSKVTDNSIKEHDVLLFLTGNAKIPNHAAVWLGNNTILHHAYNRLSCKEVYGGYWAKTRVSTYRYKDFL